MGLDMYAMKTKTTPPGPVDFELDEREIEHFHGWRKHPNLHGWMEQLYYHKGGQQKFNLQPVVLTDADLGRLERAVIAGDLPHTEGFFFGQSRGDEREGDLEFVSKAREAIAAGFTVIYGSWW